MTTFQLTPDELVGLSRPGLAVAPWTDPRVGAIVNVPADEQPIAGWPEDASAVTLLPAVIVGRHHGPMTDVRGAAAARWCDVIVDNDGDLDRIEAQMDAAPTAAIAFAQLLRASERRSMLDGLTLESAVYSTLLASSEFQRWRAARARKERAEPPGPAVRIERHDNDLLITLHRPHVRNALNSAVRDGLLEALELAHADATIESVTLAGDGPDFCSGGDLDEFGSFPDPALAHLTRQVASIGMLIAGLGDRLSVQLHGACFGSGIELPAFAGRVHAAPDTRIALPELSLGLVPGAGGTWSLPQRIGRHRTAWLGLTGHAVDATTAHEWGLVDRISG